MIKMVSSFLFLLAVASVIAQDADRAEYELLLTEADLYSRYQTGNAELSLVDSARFYAGQESYGLAVIFLEQFLDQHQTNSSPEFKPEQSITPKWELSWTGGIDFNRQEFELGYLESDSLIKDQIQKPFAEVQAGLNLLKSQQGTIGVSASARVDKENTTGGVVLQSDYNRPSLSAGFRAAWQADKNTPYPAYSYNQWASRQNLHWQPGERWQLTAYNEIRLKTYQEPSTTVPDFINNNLQASLQFAPETFTALTLDYLNLWNESRATRNNDFLQQSLILTSAFQKPGGMDLAVGLGGEDNRFTYGLGDSLLSNKSASAIGNLETTIPLGGMIVLKSQSELRYKQFQRKSEEEPDYFYLASANQLRFRLSPALTIGSGYNFEWKQHQHFSGSIESYIDEQNYYGNGLIVSLDYMKMNGFFTSAEVSYTWRRFPLAQSESWSGLYADRNILNLNLLLQYPFTEHVQFNLFLSYDNDTDIDSDAGNTRSTVFSSALHYIF